MKKTLTILISIITAHSYADNYNSTKNIYNTYNYFTKNDINNLHDLANSSQEKQIPNYYLAMARLKKSDPTQAIAFIDTYKNSALSNDLKHQLLSFFFKTQNWLWYTTTFKLLSTTQPSSNEKCGYDLANYVLNKDRKLTIDINEVIRNKMPTWCVSLIATQIANEKLNNDAQDQFLFNLLLNNQISQFSQIVDSLNIHSGPLSYQTPITNDSSKYQVVYRISSIAIKDPIKAQNELESSSIDNDTKQYLYNYLGYVFATKQMFNEAKYAIENGNNKYLSDNEYEWKARTYIALSDWKNTNKIINQMPTSLQNKNGWIYWKAFSLNKLGNKSDALSTLNKMPKSFDYYSLLGQSTLKTPLVIESAVIPTTFENIKFYEDAMIGFNLYKAGQENNIKPLTKLGTQVIYSVINTSDDSDIAAISDKAYQLNMNQTAIYAGTRIKQLDPSRAYPILFANSYQKHGKENNIESSLALAITRQESRFNPDALAFDGGVGLMQLMPLTAAYIAKKTGSSNCYKDYDCNIKFGSWYLSHLSSKFNGNLIYASAGYNAGPGRAHKWQSSFNNLDNSVQIELIPFKITHDYVQHILSNKLIYDNIINQTPLDMNSYLNKISNQDTGYINDDDNTAGDATSPATNNINNDEDSQ